MLTFEEALQEAQVKVIPDDVKSKVFADLTSRKKSHEPNVWGGKGFLVDVISKEYKLTKKAAEALFKEWADKNK
jgi:hypothetical protein